MMENGPSTTSLANPPGWRMCTWLIPAAGAREAGCTLERLFAILKEIDYPGRYPSNAAGATVFMPKRAARCASANRWQVINDQG